MKSSRKGGWLGWFFVQMHVIDPSVILDEWDKWSRLWNEIIINPVK